MIQLDKSPYIIAAANYVASIDPETCIACGLCAEERCPVNAIESDNERYEVNTWRCIGCGVCVLTCPSGALSLIPKEEGQTYRPPMNIFEWFIKRAARERHVMEGSS
jgi:MinD superfamily P-loop ATPase